jgi:hypothetical protein
MQQKPARRNACPVCGLPLPEPVLIAAQRVILGESYLREAHFCPGRPVLLSQTA